MADTDSDAITPLEGKTTIDDKMFFEPERLSYESAVVIAGDIATKLGNEIEGQVVVIAGTQLLVDLNNLQAVYLRLESLRKEYSALTALTREIVGRRQAEKVAASSSEEAATLDMPSFANVTAGITPVGAAVQAAIGLVSLLREDVEYHGAKTTVDTLAFEIALADRLKEVSRAKRVFIPDLMVMQTVQKGGGSLQERLNGVQKARTDAWELIGPLVAELVRLEADLDLAVREKNEARVNGLTTRISELRRDMQPVSDPLSRADRALAELQTQWNAADASSVSMLARLLRA